MYARLDITRWNTIFDRLIRTYNKLIKLGFMYYNGKIPVIQGVPGMQKAPRNYATLAAVIFVFLYGFFLFGHYSISRSCSFLFTKYSKILIIIWAF